MTILFTGVAELVVAIDATGFALATFVVAGGAGIAVARRVVGVGAVGFGVGVVDDEYTQLF